MEARLVDPRATRWEVDAPEYRVDLWTGSGACEEWELLGAKDVHEVLAWVSANARGRSPVVYARCLGPDGEPGLLRLLGTDPTR